MESSFLNSIPSTIIKPASTNIAVISQASKTAMNIRFSNLIHTSSHALTVHNNIFKIPLLPASIQTKTRTFSTATTCSPSGCSTSAAPSSASQKYKKLFSPMKIGKVEIKNRVVLEPMGLGICNHDGTVSDHNIEYYSERARNGVGLIITEYTRVNHKEGISSVGQLSLAYDEHIKGVSRLCDAVHKNGGKIFIQIHHPGRMGNPLFPTLWPKFEKLGKIIPGFWKLYDKYIEKAFSSSSSTPNIEDIIKMQKHFKPILAPSKMPTPQEESDVALWFVKHRAMTLQEVQQTEKEFINAAVRAKKAGADGVELHGAHGYLLQQFLSPYTNRRTDEYGGSFENRCRFVKNIIKGIRKECGPDFPVIIRLTVDEFHDKAGHPERGYHLEEGVRLAQTFEKCGVDAIDVSVGSTEALAAVIESMRYPEGWRQDLAKAVKDAVSIPVIAAGIIRTPSQAEKLLEDGKQDFIGLARSLLSDSQWVKKTEENRENEISRCICCLNCLESTNLYNNKPFECSLNPRVLKEIDYPEQPPQDGHGRKVVVVGAGPAGLMAANELARRGFQVTVFEKESKEGGQLNLADKPPCKDRIIWTTQDFRAQAEGLGVTLRFGEEATVEKIKEISPTYVIMATGGHAIHPTNIPGASEDYVCTSTPVLKGDICPEEKNVIVIGSGLTGLDTAELLVSHKNKVTVVEMADRISPGAHRISLREIIPELNKHGVQFKAGHKLEKIEDHKAILSTRKGEQVILDADLIVLALGVKSETQLAEALTKSTNIPVYKIGDANKPGKIVDAVKQAFITARSLK